MIKALYLIMGLILILVYRNERSEIIVADITSSVSYTIDHNCYVGVAASGEIDDSPAIRRAFNLALSDRCPDGTVHLDPKTYIIRGFVK